MAEIGKVTFSGLSGAGYAAVAYPIDQKFNSVGAVYVITKRYVQNGTVYFEPLYVGVTGDLSSRFDDHHKADAYTRKGANSICIHREDNERSRFTKETDLIRRYNPCCNG